MNEATLRTVPAIIKTLGGPAVVGRRVKRTPQQVCNWKNAGTLPGWTYPIFLEDLKKLGMRPSRKLFRELADVAF